MQRWQLPFLGLSQPPPTLTEFEIEQFFTFSETEFEAIQSRRGKLNRLGIALQLGFLRMTGRHLDGVHVLPVKILQHIGTQLQVPVPTIASLRGLYKNRRSRFYHQNFVAELLNFKPLSDYTQRSLVTFLRREASTCIVLPRLELVARRWLYEHKFLIPPSRQLRIIVQESIAHADAKLLSEIDQQIPAKQNP
jgi:hypothetical protein